MTNNIPELLKIRPNFNCWRYEDHGGKKLTKVPYDAKTGKHASVTNPETWSTFEVAVAASIYYDGIGFVFDGGIVGIDLDDPYEKLEDGSYKFENPEEVAKRHSLIIDHFPGYWEISPSGKGVHGFVLGNIESGRRREGVELYCKGRYFTMTGNVFKNDAIVNHQNEITQLWEELTADKNASNYYHKDEPQTQSDYDILVAASSATNGERFKQWYDGNWQDFYESQSECDYALVNCISYYSRNREQIARIFRASQLGKRSKALRDKYVYYMIEKSFDNQLPPVDLEGLKQNLEAKLIANQQALAAIEKLSPTPTMPSLEIAPQTANGSVEISPESTKTRNLEQIGTVNEKKQTKPVKAVKSPYDLPPGLLGMIAQFIYEAAPRPVPEIALAGAIGLMSGVCGRSFNISGTGLNTYTFLLGFTGSGKEALSSGIDKLIANAVKTVPAAVEFIGPSEIASPQALLKYLTKTSKCFVSVMGEFADTLERMTNKSHDASQRGLRRTMLDLYNKSGNGKTLGKMIYSDKDKNTDVITAPSFSVVGEATPEKFYKLLSEDMIDEGLLPRFSIIEYKGKRPQLNKEHVNVVPSDQLSNQFSALCAYSLQLNNGNNVINISINLDAQKMFDDYDKFCDAKINNGTEINKQLWNRGHIKALKLAGVLAIGCHYSNPVVDVTCAEWAMNFVTHDIENIVTRFEVGEVGTASVQNDQVDDLKKAFKRYVTSEFESVKGYPGISLTLWSLKVVPQSFLTAYCRSRSSFKNDKLGPIQAIRTCLASMCECDEIRELSLQDKRQRNLPLNPKLYVISGMVI